MNGKRNMSIDLNALDQAFRAKVDRALDALAGEGLIFTPYNALRDPVTQARFWRQSRSTAVIEAQIQSLRQTECDFIADCLVKAGPASGPWATNALPGLSWHQYGKAVDCYLVNANGQPVWESPSYARFGQVGDANGMWWGGHFGDNDHWQDSNIVPLQALGSLKEINDALALKWGDLV